MTHPKHPPAAEQGASTGSRAASAREREISAEQEVVDRAYRELDRRLESARASLAATQASPTGGTHQSRGERDAYAAHYAGLVASLEGVEDRLVFGRMDLAPDAAGAGSAGAGGRHYVGRAGLQDSRRREVVLDWRAPLARAFYQATASNPMGLVRRRHIDTRRRRVIGLEDEVVDVRSLREGGPAGARAAAEGLQGEGALIAAMSAARHGRMGDIVATIQAEQDRVVTSGTRGVLVVQGGPGTGKTAVALHRVAYLFYSERTRLERSGVLLVGPSRTFLRYVEQVLPSLGETGVVSTTIADLVPGVRARGVEDPRVHEIKGRALWAEVLRRARLVQHHQVQRESLSVREHMSEILRKLQNLRFAEFHELFDLEQGTAGVVVTFVAMLELARESLLQITQAEAFAPIYVRLSYLPSKARPDPAESDFDADESEIIASD